MFNLALDIKRIDGSDESPSPQAPVVPNHSLRQVGQHEAYDAPFIDLEGDQRLRELVGKNIQLTIPDDAAIETEGGTGWEAGRGLGQQLGQGDVWIRQCTKDTWIILFYPFSVAHGPTPPYALTELRAALPSSLKHVKF